MPMTTLGEVLLFLIERGPGRTEQQLAEAIYGPGGYQTDEFRDRWDRLV